MSDIPLHESSPGIKMVGGNSVQFFPPFCAGVVVLLVFLTPTVSVSYTHLRAQETVLDLV